LLHMVLLDTDHMVEQADGRAIPDIFAQDGEVTFRDKETAAAKQAAQISGFKRSEIYKALVGSKG
ncbi:MAG: hypothetical protein II286_01530, partial [Clostridia bacterium]|nr:hypothetical protein [Clostridia bacterium]